MPFLLADPGNRGLLREFAVGLLTAVERDSVAFQIATTMTSNSYRVQIPRLAGHTSAAWVSELEEIPQSALDVETDDVILAKVAGLATISNEAVFSEAQDLVNLHGSDLRQQIVRQIDTAFFTKKASGDTKSPAGLADRTDLQTLEVGPLTNLDPIFAAISHLNSSPDGLVADSITMHPADLLKVRQLKEATGSQKGLVETDASFGTVGLDGKANVVGRLAGLELRTSPYMPVGTVWVTARRGLVTVRTGEAEVVASTDSAFSQDATQVRAKMGVAFGVASPDAAIALDITTP
ncbi:MAG TPA: phage major capsid protein [Candidatus Dietzia merdigallinarum]|nr:phage major capsid protein [Candidatus Dietzia merdigallinarum]